MNSPNSDAEDVLRYHEETKHHEHRYARSLGYMDWENQPSPFRFYEDVPVIPLPLLTRDPGAGYLDLFESARSTPGEPFTLQNVAGFLELSLALSAWKAVPGSRWALRMNPSSGNLHPTEAHLVLPEMQACPGGIYHYSAFKHALERRAELPPDLWQRLQSHLTTEGFMVALTSIFWREAWKYGERAFRYCNHDLGHALAGLRFSANLFGWRLSALTGMSDAAVAGVLGLRRVRFPALEEEHPQVLCWVYAGGPQDIPKTLSGDLVSAFDQISWAGRPNSLSREHVNWEIISATAERCRKPPTEGALLRYRERPWVTNAGSRLSAAQIIRRRRSATDLDRRASAPRSHFLAMLDKTLPRPDTAPFDADIGAPELNLMIFVHAVTGLEAGLYFFSRTDEDAAAIRSHMHPEFLWQPAEPGFPLFLLIRGDFRATAARVSCHQDIAGSGILSLGMLARFGECVRREPFRYRYLFWESGMIGQALYLEAEALGLRGTGIGCFFDDSVHDLLGLTTDRYQSLYHFTVGHALEDPRLTTYPPYFHLTDR